MGDTYSWTIVAPVLMKLFGGKNGTLAGSAASRAEAAENAASKLLTDIERLAESGIGFGSEGARLEAVAKLVENHAAVIADAISTEPKSQKDLSRLHPTKAPAVDATLRAVAAALIAGGAPLVPATDSSGKEVDLAEVAHTARYVAGRLCVPRDM